MTKEINIEEYSATLEKRFGKGIITDASTILSEEKKIVSVCPSLDIGLSGGIPQGSWVICSGKPRFRLPF